MKILVAEDDVVFQLMLRTALSKWGYEPVVVHDGEEAWEQLRSPAGPRLAILDWVMPLADGPEVCRRVRRGNVPHYVYIILLTGKTNSADLVAGLEAGADDFLAKPVNLNELKMRLRAGSRVLDFEEQYRVIAETASDGIVAMFPEDRIYFANGAAAAMFGYSQDELIGQSFSLLVPGFERLPGENLRTAKPLEITGKHRKGREMILEVSFSESSNGHRRLTAMIRDATEKRLLERQLAQAQKLESIGRLAAGVAHEINTPIQYIGDNARFLEDAFRELFTVVAPSRAACEADSRNGITAVAEVDTEYLCREIPKSIQQLVEGVDHVARIVRSMKELSHPGLLTKTSIDINQAVENTLLVSKNEWKYVAEIAADLDWDLPPIPCFAGELNQVILNLVVNSSHAIAEVVRDSGRRGQIRVTTLRAGEWAQIQVSDTGCGIPEEDLAKVFDPFFTTKEVGKGTGQGLAIAHSVVVQKHAGTIAVESQVGVGTTFTIRLPISAAISTREPRDSANPSLETYLLPPA